MNRLPISEFRFSISRFIAIFLLLNCMFIAIFYYDLNSEIETRASNTQVQQKALLEGKKDYIEWVMSSVVKETALLADILTQRKIYQTAAQPESEQKQSQLQQFANALKVISHRKEIYDQIRYLDIKGNEVIRINFNDGVPTIVPKEALQNKLHRYYFDEVLRLGCRKIYVSPLDLNIEHGQIEIPFKPMIRIATAIFDESGTKQGVVIINYLAHYLLDGLELFNLNSGTNYMLINSTGEFLYNRAKPELEFAFMFDASKSATIYSQFPTVAEQIKQTQKGQFETKNGIMTIESVGSLGRDNPYCFQEYHVSGNDSTRWKLVSFSPFNQQLNLHNALISHSSLFVLGFGISAILAALITHYQLRKYRDDKRIHYLAHYDSLTNLLNRWAFRSRSEQLVRSYTKWQKPLCLIYIDLDDFKSINDRYGHATGDKALIHVAEMMTKTFGNNALLCRLGGDEFAVLLHNDKHLNQPEQLANKLIQTLQDPIEVAPQVYDQINISIGGIVERSAHTHLDELMHQADMAMYQAKRAGKNCAVITRSEQPNHNSQPQ